MSYRKKHVKHKIQNIQPKTPLYAKLWFWCVLAGVVFVFVVLYFVLWFPGLQITEAAVTGNNKISSAEMQEAVLDKANTVLFGLWKIKITSRSIFLANKSNIKKDILKQFPIIEHMDVSKKYPKTISVAITERKPIGTYCTMPQDLASSSFGNCFLIDQNGVIFKPAEPGAGNLAIVRQASEDKDIHAGETVIQKNIISAINSIQNTLKNDFHIDIKEAFVSSPTRLDIKTSESWRVYFDMGNSADVGMQITKLNLLLKGELAGENRAILRYIDLRPKDRAIICDTSACGN